MDNRSCAFLIPTMGGEKKSNTVDEGKGSNDKEKGNVEQKLRLIPGQQQEQQGANDPSKHLYNTNTENSNYPFISLLEHAKKNTRVNDMGINGSPGVRGIVDNPDNSPLVRLRNDSFGFNFDVEERMLVRESDDSNGRERKRQDPSTRMNPQACKVPELTSSLCNVPQHLKNTSNIEQMQNTPKRPRIDEEREAAFFFEKSTIDQLHLKSQTSMDDSLSSATKPPDMKHVLSTDTLKYDSDNSKNTFSQNHKPDTKRVERNAREKERSFRIACQIDDLRNLLSKGGVIVPKGTKSSVLTEAANYIRMLQQHQYRSEIERQQLIQQVQIIGSGALGADAATAIRHSAVQNGVWSLGNFGGPPPSTDMIQQQQGVDGADVENQKKSNINFSKLQDTSKATKVEEFEYRNIFNSCGVGMAVASMGGAFVDCNKLFMDLTGYNKQEISSLTVFNLIDRADLQYAFDLISKMISPPVVLTTFHTDEEITPPVILKGSFKDQSDLGLSVSLVMGDNSVATHFCVSLMKISAPFSKDNPTPATVADIHKSDNMSSPAYTTG